MYMYASSVEELPAAHMYMYMNLHAYAYGHDYVSLYQKFVSACRVSLHAEHGRAQHTTPHWSHSITCISTIPSSSSERHRLQHNTNRRRIGTSSILLTVFFVWRSVLLCVLCWSVHCVTFNVCCRLSAVRCGVCVCRMLCTGGLWAARNCVVCALYMLAA